MNPYIGHPSQLYGVEEVRLIGGKADGMRLMQVHNADGLAFVVSADRCADISRVSYKGVNMSYFAPCGYVAPTYYDDRGAGFLKSFTAGFFTTCGLTNVGPACQDDGESLPQHGTIGNLPCERIWWEETDDSIEIHAQVNDSRMFGRKLMLTRVISCKKHESIIKISDTVENQGDCTSPLMLLYHMNLGYPLLSEQTQIFISSVRVEPCTPYAAEGLSSWAVMPPPRKGAQEQCYDHYFAKEGCARVYNPQIRKGLELTFDPQVLDHMTQWKMPGFRDYALGLEPGNCTTAGRDEDRKNGNLKFLQPGESKTFELTVRFFSAPCYFIMEGETT